MITVRLGLLLLPVGLAVFGFILTLVVDATTQDRASRRNAAVLRETAPILPWPSRDHASSAQDRLRVNAHAQRERGGTDGRFLRNLTMVCFAVLVFSGLVVYWIDHTTSRPANDPPAQTRQGRPATEQARPEPTHKQAQRGGGGCG